MQDQCEVVENLKEKFDQKKDECIEWLDKQPPSSDTSLWAATWWAHRWERRKWLGSFVAPNICLIFYIPCIWWAKYPYTWALPPTTVWYARVSLWFISYGLLMDQLPPFQYRLDAPPSLRPSRDEIDCIIWLDLLHIHLLSLKGRVGASHQDSILS